MFRHVFTLRALGGLLCGGLLVSCLRAQAADKKNSVVIDSPGNLSVQVEDLHPFTHFALIPAGSDVRTIRFEHAKTVEVPTKIIYTTDADYCAELIFRDPGQSMYCPRVQTGSPVKAYEITYSFRGQPLASDEYGNTHFTFQVYFRPDELSAEIRKALSTRKLGWADTAGYFTVTTFREPEQRVVIDQTRSKLCDTVLRDGSWIHADSDCQDRVYYKTIATEAADISVRVDPAMPR
jgi:hypothetical protein